MKEFEIAMVNEPSVFEPLKFYCICNLRRKQPGYSLPTIMENTYKQIYRLCEAIDIPLRLTLWISTKKADNSKLRM